ncbi:protein STRICTOSIDINE SYNTHASE-LIKE 10-like [Panicum virgatum]|uniref:protein STRICTOSIDINE SYNTHASE-LIKE 10-like n=1 Tax=Panicum virgatum TaxID=38727 RepID=UPI0019D57A4F|nr:protein STRICTOSIDINE SYNTHASE-LIKE 10-like [Panicum virgatum]
MSCIHAMSLLLLSSSCFAHAKQIKAKLTPWSIHVSKPGGGTRSLAFEHICPSNKNTPVCTASADQPDGAESVCGHPLGRQFHPKTGDLYIADAYLGLMKVGLGSSEAEVLATEAGGVPFNFVNGVDVDRGTGNVCFTKSSTVYTCAHNTEIMIHRDAIGRLLRYDAQSRRAIVLKTGQPYPNGVALSASRTHVMVAHMGPCQAFRYWLRGPKAGHYELLADLPGYRTTSGVTTREATGSRSTGRRSTRWIQSTSSAFGSTLREHEVMMAPKGVMLSDIAEKDGNLLLGSVKLNYVGLAS